MAMIENLISGKDGVTRGATVKKVGVDGNPVLLNRPFQKLYPLEIRRDGEATTSLDLPAEREKLTSNRHYDACDLTLTNGNSNDVLAPAKNAATTPQTKIDVDVQATRPKRSAAIIGERRRRNAKSKN